MKSKLLLTSAFLGLIFLSSCWRKCKDPLQCNFPEEFLKYTKVYKPGNWWAFSNLDGSWHDTFYVEDYKESKILSNLCWEGTNITFSLKGKTKTFPCEIITDGSGGCEFRFMFNYRDVLAYRDSIQKRNGTIDTPPLILNGNVYYGVHFHNSSDPFTWTYALAKDIGIVLHIDNVDTLVLFEYHIQ